jgi:hypothetical protein
MGVEYIPEAQRIEAALEATRAVIRERVGRLEPGEVVLPTAWEDAIRRDLQALQGVIEEGAQRLGSQSFLSGAELGAQNLRAQGVVVNFSRPTLETIQAGISYVDNPAFAAKVARFGEYHAASIKEIVLSSIVGGRSPSEAAGLISRYMDAPLADAKRLVRTTQLYSARQGTRAIYAANNVDYWQWSANIGDPRTCIACVLMHGTKHPVSEVLNDHHNGRCSPIPVTASWASLGLEGGREREELLGRTWLEGQPEAQQIQIMGRARWQAWKDGRFGLEEIVGTYNDDLFGEMRQARSLADLLQGR